MLDMRLKKDKIFIKNVSFDVLVIKIMDFYYTKNN